MLSLDPPHLPLEGLLVIDFGDAWSAPFACTMLADAGANVIRVEDIHRQLSTLRGPIAPKGKLDGYPDSEPGARPWNRYYLMNNSERNKRGITLDVQHEKGRELLSRLVQKADIFVTNYSPRAVRDLRLTFADLLSLNGRIVYAHVTGYGCEGELADRVALGSTIDAWTGHMALRGYPDTTPYDTPQSYIADSAGATTLAFALLTALESRDQTGEGQCVELALTESLIPFLVAPLMEQVLDTDVRAPHGNRSPVWAPQGVYPCLGADRWISISITSDIQWCNFCRILGIDPETYSTNESRLSAHDEIDDCITERTRNLDGIKLMRDLQEWAIPSMFLFKDTEILNHPEFTGDNFLQTLEHPDTGQRMYPGPVWRSQSAPMHVRRPHFGLGEHNYEILCGELGLSENDYAQLVKDGVIGEEYSFWPRDN